jgi:hypothetical protein
MKRVMMLLLMAGVLFLSGCATGEYAKYADSSVAMDKEEANEQSAKLEALTMIATDPKASDATKASVAMAIVMMPSPKKRQLVAPKDPADLALGMAGLGLKAYQSWIGLFEFGINASRKVTQEAADPDVINRGFSAGTIQFGAK